MLLELATAEAEHVRRDLAPWCLRLEVAGSVRRGERRCGDLELVCIPDKVCFAQFSRIISSWPKLKGEPGGRYTRRRLPSGNELDLFIVNAQTWGVQLALRTGCAEFSRELVIRANKLDTPCHNGRIWGADGRALETPEEADVFAALQVPYVQPRHRTPEVAERLANLPLKRPAAVQTRPAQLKLGMEDTP